MLTIADWSAILDEARSPGKLPKTAAMAPHAMQTFPSADLAVLVNENQRPEGRCSCPSALPR
jgi:hypothetical protein